MLNFDEISGAAVPLRYLVKKGALFDGETLDAAHARLRAVVNAEVDGDIARDGLVNPEEGPSGGSFDQGGEREREGDD